MNMSRQCVRVLPVALILLSANAPAEVWGYFRARSCVYRTRAELRIRPGEPGLLEFTDIGRFGY